MKRLLYGIIGIMALLALGCNSNSSTDNAQKADGAQKTMSLLTLSTSSLYAVPLDTAVNNIKRYHKKIKIYDSLVAVSEGKKPNHKMPLKGFTIRSADLFESMGMPLADTTKATYKYIRVYLGFDYKSQFKLYLTPVQGANLNAHPPVAGEDVILKGDFFMLGDDGSYVLDFTSPCPNTCPAGSPLNQ